MSIKPNSERVQARDKIVTEIAAIEKEIDDKKRELTLKKSELRAICPHEQGVCGAGVFVCSICGYDDA